MRFIICCEILYAISMRYVDHWIVSALKVIICVIIQHWWTMVILNDGHYIIDKSHYYYYSLFSDNLSLTCESSVMKALSHVSSVLGKNDQYYYTYFIVLYFVYFRAMYASIDIWMFFLLFVLWFMHLRVWRWQWSIEEIQGQIHVSILSSHPLSLACGIVLVIEICNLYEVEIYCG